MPLSRSIRNLSKILKDFTLGQAPDDRRFSREEQEDTIKMHTFETEKAIWEEKLNTRNLAYDNWQNQVENLERERRRMLRSASPSSQSYGQFLVADRVRPAAIRHFSEQVEKAWNEYNIIHEEIDKDCKKLIRRTQKAFIEQLNDGRKNGHRRAVEALSWLNREAVEGDENAKNFLQMMMTKLKKLNEEGEGRIIKKKRKSKRRKSKKSKKTKRRRGTKRR